MTWKCVILLALLTPARAQLYDILQGYQPPPTYTPTKISDFVIYPQALRFTGGSRDREKIISSISQDIDVNLSNMRKTLSSNDMFNINFVTTPTVRKATKRNTQKNTNNGNEFSSFANNKRKAPNYPTDSQFDDYNVPNNFHSAKAKTNYPENVRRHDSVTNRPSVNSNTNHFPVNMEQAVEFDYHTTPEVINAAHGNFNNPAANVGRSEYVTNRPSPVGNKNHFANAVPTANISYYTSPVTIRPGVKPADVDINQPPITNKPPSDVLNDSPANEEQQSREPVVVAGPDVNEMSSQERRRYEGMVDKMCEQYKSSTLKKVEAIPLVPSPEPVQVNVSACHPKKIPLVVGGKIVSIEEFPHMALLGWNKVQGGGYSWKCGGSLISERYILTAGHCLYQDKDDTVVSGPPRVVQLGSSYMDDKRALLVGVEEAIRHPKYTKTRAYYDAALLRLVRDVVFTEQVKPACLGEPPAVDEHVIATGWGKTEVAGGQSLELRSVSIPVWNMAECRQVLGTSRKLPLGPSEDSQLCAGEREGGKDTCQGDSGGPAQVQEGCTWRIVAITSLGRSCGAINTPALYATIDKAFIGAQLFGNFNEYKKDKNDDDKPNTNYSTQPNGNRIRNVHNAHENDDGIERDYATSSESISNYNINNGNKNNNKHNSTKYDSNKDNSANIRPITGLSNNDRGDNEQKHNSDNLNYDNQDAVRNNYGTTQGDNAYNNIRPVSSLNNNKQRNNEHNNNNREINSNDRLIFSTTTKIDRNANYNKHNANIRPVSGLNNNNDRNKEANNNNRREIGSYGNINNNEENDAKYNQNTNSREAVLNPNSTPITNNNYNGASNSRNRYNNDYNNRFEASNNDFTLNRHTKNYNAD